MVARFNWKLVEGVTECLCLEQANPALHYPPLPLPCIYPLYFAQVSYREFDFGHLDFTFAVKEELKRFLLHSLSKWA
jgi:hypothetical protein